MHGTVRLILWLIVTCGLCMTEKFIPPQETAFRTLVALTFMLWCLVGAAYGVRGIWRFMRS